MLFLQMICLRSFDHHDDIRAKVTDAEVITIVLVAMLYFGGNLEEYNKLYRKPIETAFGGLMKMFPKKIRVTSFKGFILKISVFLFAFQIDKALINN